MIMKHGRPLMFRCPNGPNRGGRVSWPCNPALTDHTIPEITAAEIMMACRTIPATDL